MILFVLFPFRLMLKPLLRLPPEFYQLEWSEFTFRHLVRKKRLLENRPDACQYTQ